MFRQKLRSKKAQAERAQRIRSWVRGIVIVVIILVVGFFVALNQSFMRIGSIEVQGNESVFADDIIESVQERLSMTMLWIYPHDTWLLYPRKLVQEKIVRDFSRVERARLRVENFDTLVITITEHQPEYLWCQNETDCFYIDKESYIFAEAPYFSDHVYLKFEGAHVVVPPDPLRSQVYRTEELARVLELVDKFMDTGLDVYKIRSTGFQDYSFFVDRVNGVRVGPDSHVRINLVGDNARIIENLELALAQEGLQTKLQNQPEELDYIDLRFEDKVLFRFGAPLGENEDETDSDDASEDEDLTNEGENT